MHEGSPTVKTALLARSVDSKHNTVDNKLSQQFYRNLPTRHARRPSGWNIKQKAVDQFKRTHTKQQRKALKKEWRKWAQKRFKLIWFPSVLLK